MLETLLAVITLSSDTCSCIYTIKCIECVNWGVLGNSGINVFVCTHSSIKKKKQ
jgi:hypothetical protein